MCTLQPIVATSAGLDAKDLIKLGAVLKATGSPEVTAALAPAERGPFVLVPHDAMGAGLTISVGVALLCT